MYGLFFPNLCPADSFEQALIDLGYDSPPLDDFVLTANIENVTSLTINRFGISDLTRIEDFTALQFLYSAFNNLTSIDLSQNILKNRPMALGSAGPVSLAHLEFGIRRA